MTDLDTYNTLIGATAQEYAVTLIAFSPNPSLDDYEFGSIVRYFARPANFHSASVLEINEQNYNRAVAIPFYITTSLKWVISGPDHDVSDQNGIQITMAISKANKLAIDLAKQTIPNIDSKLINVYQFWRGF